MFSTMLELAKKWKRAIDKATASLEEASIVGSSLQVSSHCNSLLLERTSQMLDLLFLLQVYDTNPDAEGEPSG